MKGLSNAILDETTSHIC